MRSSLVLIGMSVVVLSLGAFVPQGEAAALTKEQKLAIKEYTKLQALALKELRQKYSYQLNDLRKSHVSATKELAGSWKKNGLTTKEYRSQVNLLAKDYQTQRKAWALARAGALKEFKKYSQAQWAAWKANGYRKEGDYNGGYTGGPKSVPIPGTELLFASGFAGIVYYRLRQRRAGLHPSQ